MQKILLIMTINHSRVFIVQSDSFYSMDLRIYICQMIVVEHI